MQDALPFLGSSSQAWQGSRRRRCCSTGRQSALGLVFQFSAHATVSSPRILQIPETLLGLLEHIIWLWSCYQTPNHDSFLPIGNGQSSCQLPSHAQKCSGCQVAWIKSEPRTSPKCEWQCLCSDPYVIQPISVEVGFIKRLYDNAWKQSFLWERPLATKMAFPV